MGDFKQTAEFNREKLEAVLDRANMLLVALEKCRYECYNDGGKVVVAGLIDFLSRCQDSVEEIVSGPGIGIEQLDFIADKTANVVKQLQYAHGDLTETPEHTVKRGMFDEFVDGLTDPATYKYIRTILPGRKEIVRYDTNGNIQTMFYVKWNGAKEVRDGPFIYCSDGSPKEIGYYRDGKPVGAWTTCGPDGSTRTTYFKDPKWFQGDPKRLKELYDSFTEKFQIVEQENDEDIGWGAILAGSVATIALTTLLSRKSSANTIKEKKTQDHLVREI